MNDAKKNPIVTVCMDCGRVRRPDGSWSTEDTAAGAVISHGLCPTHLAVRLSAVATLPLFTEHLAALTK